MVFFKVCALKTIPKLQFSQKQQISLKFCDVGAIDHGEN